MTQVEESYEAHGSVLETLHLAYCFTEHRQKERSVDSNFKKEEEEKYFAL